MPDIQIKDRNGNYVTYTNVNTVSFLGSDGVSVESYQSDDTLHFMHYDSATPAITQDSTDITSSVANTLKSYMAATSTTVTIAVADWAGGTTCTKTVTGVTGTNIVIVDPSDATIECTAQALNQLTFTAQSTPTVAITVKVVIL